MARRYVVRRHGDIFPCVIGELFGPYVGYELSALTHRGLASIFVQMGDAAPSLPDCKVGGSWPGCERNTG